MYRRETGLRGERTAPGDERDQDEGSRGYRRSAAAMADLKLCGQKEYLEVYMRGKAADDE